MATAALGRHTERPYGRVSTASSPGAFPPTFVLEHVGGCVSTIVPVPHAEPGALHRITVSTERARLDLGLPTGALCRTTYRGSGVVTRSVLVDSVQVTDPPSLFGGLMADTVEKFIDAVADQRQPSCTFADEARVRDVWAALVTSSRSKKRVALTTNGA